MLSFSITHLVLQGLKNKYGNNLDKGQVEQKLDLPSNFNNKSSAKSSVPR